MKRDFNKYKIPTISLLATDNNITSLDGYISQVSIDNYTQVLVASHYIRDERFIENIGVVYDEGSYYSSVLAQEFKDYFITLGANIDFFIDIGQESGLKELESIDTKKIKMLFNTTNATKSLKVLQIMKDKKFDFEMLGTDGLYSDALEFGEENLKLFNGVYVVEHYAHDVEKTDNRKILNNMLDKNGLKGSSNSFLAYDAYQLLIYALESCSDYNTKCINSVFKDSGVIVGISGNFSMIEAKAKREVYVDKIEDSILKKEVVIY